MTTLTGRRTEDGRSLRAAIGGRVAGERTLCWRFADPLVKPPLSYAVRQEQWKLLQQDEESALYDLAGDPEETRNVIAVHPAVAKKLAALIKRIR